MKLCITDARQAKAAAKYLSKQTGLAVTHQITNNGIQLRIAADNDQALTNNHILQTILPGGISIEHDPILQTNDVKLSDQRVIFGLAQKNLELGLALTNEDTKHAEAAKLLEQITTFDTALEKLSKQNGAQAANGLLYEYTNRFIKRAVFTASNNLTTLDDVTDTVNITTAYLSNPLGKNTGANFHTRINTLNNRNNYYRDLAATMLDIVGWGLTIGVIALGIANPPLAALYATTLNVIQVASLAPILGAIYLGVTRHADPLAAEMQGVDQAMKKAAAPAPA